MDYNKKCSPPPPYPGTAPPQEIFHYQPQAQHHVYQPPPQQHHVHQPVHMTTTQSSSMTVASSSAGAPVHTVQTSVVMNSSSETHCPRCHTLLHVEAKYHPSWKTYCFSALLFLGFCWPCVCVPCYMKTCYRTSQICSKCQFRLSTY
nr:uncharacterized protein LOC108076261 [Drosophila kikkawai]